jgi:hypothetical protein
LAVNKILDALKGHIMTDSVSAVGGHMQGKCVMIHAHFATVVNACSKWQVVF